jgi:hypothetical protein
MASFRRQSGFESSAAFHHQSDCEFGIAPVFVAQMPQETLLRTGCLNSGFGSACPSMRNNPPLFSV